MLQLKILGLFRQRKSHKSFFARILLTHWVGIIIIGGQGGGQAEALAIYYMYPPPDPPLSRYDNNYGILFPRCNRKLNSRFHVKS